MAAPFPVSPTTASRVDLEKSRVPNGVISCYSTAIKGRNGQHRLERGPRRVLASKSAVKQGFIFAVTQLTIIWNTDTGDKLISIKARHTGKGRSEEHTSELQSRPHLVCRLL